MTNKQVDVLSSENKAIQNREEELNMTNKEVMEKLEVILEKLDEVHDELDAVKSHPYNLNRLTTAYLKIGAVKNDLDFDDGSAFELFKEFILNKEDIQPEDINFFEHPDEYYTVSYHGDGKPYHERYSHIKENDTFQLFFTSEFSPNR